MIIDETLDFTGGEKTGMWALTDEWQPNDPRIVDFLEMSWAMTDAFDYSHFPSPEDKEKASQEMKPLELAQAMERAAQRIRLLTMHGHSYRMDSN